MTEDWRIERYEPSKMQRWNQFVASSRNATFLFNRSYMDYHSDRFEDCSWLAYKNDRLLAMLPANITDGQILQSHGGLSYGGWILPAAHLDGAGVMELFYAAAIQWKKSGIKTLDYKPLPYFYAESPSEEDIYALFRLGAEITEVNLSATIDLRRPVHLNQQQRRHLSKALKLNPIISETRDIDAFASLLTECLRERHDTVPVHNSSELKLLASRFPDNICFYAASLDGEMHAAVCIFDTGRVAHAQYIATSPMGRELNLLSPLFHYLITAVYAEREYFDFGISNEDHGRVLNPGLLRQKYSYGATGTAFTRYRLDLDTVE